MKKAVNWALRTIGRRNARLNAAALEMARVTQRLDSKAVRWIAADAIRELQREATRTRLGVGQPKITSEQRFPRLGSAVIQNDSRSEATFIPRHTHCP